MVKYLFSDVFIITVGFHNILDGCLGAENKSANAAQRDDCVLPQDPVVFTKATLPMDNQLNDHLEIEKIYS